MKIFNILVILLVSACSSLPMNEKRKDVVECMIKMAREEKISAKIAYIACSRIYGLSTSEPKQEDDGFTIEPTPIAVPSVTPTPVK